MKMSYGWDESPAHQQSLQMSQNPAARKETQNMRTNNGTTANDEVRAPEADSDFFQNVREGGHLPPDQGFDDLAMVAKNLQITKVDRNNTW